MKASVAGVSALLFVLGVALVAPMTAGHGGHAGFSQMKVTPDKSHYVSVEIPDAPFPIAETLHTFNVVLTETLTNEFVLNQTIGFAFRGPNAQVVNLTLTPEDAAFAAYTTRVIFPAAGDWTGNVTLSPVNQSVELEFVVYGPSPYVVNSMNAETPTGDVYITGRSVSVPLAVTYVGSGFPGPAVDDAAARLERWTEDHATKLGEREVTLEPGGPGMLYLNTTFSEDGMYHLYVASERLNLSYDDRPYIHVYSVDESRAAEYGITLEEDVPAPSLVAVLAIMIVVAVVSRPAASRCDQKRQDKK